MRAVPQASDSLLRRMTLDEWANLPGDEEGEFVDGWLVQEEVPDFLHELIVSWLLEKLGKWSRERGGVAGASDAKFAVSSSRGRKPDATVFLPGRLPPARGLVRIAPEIVIEIVSPRPRDRRRDRLEKSAEYASFGIPWYWIVEPDPLRLEIHRRNDGGVYEIALSADAGLIDDVPGCADLTLDLDELREYVPQQIESRNLRGGIELALGDLDAARRTFVLLFVVGTDRLHDRFPGGQQVAVRPLDLVSPSI